MAPPALPPIKYRVRCPRASECLTTLKLMQIMAHKGLVRRDESRRSHVYAPACSRQATRKSLVGTLIERAFAGSTSQLVLSALSAKRASRKELDAIRAFLDEQE